MSVDDYLFFNDPADMGNDDPFDIDPNDIVVGPPEEWF